MRVPLAVAGIALVSACARGGDGLNEADAPALSDTEATYAVIRANGEPLRSAFEAARGKVRAILLVSPT